MNAPRIGIPSLIPETAPFTPEQRTWLNGLFAGLISLESTPTPLSPEQAARLVPELLSGDAAPVAESIPDDVPWHDPSLALGDRMQLAAGRPLQQQLMAAMAQQDCGQCGYNCRDYAEAIFLKKEPELTRCVPGGKETARMLKQLWTQTPASPPAAPENPPLPAATDKPMGYSRDRAVEAVLLSRTRLNKAGSEKETWHLEFDLSGKGVEYAVGDCLGIYPVNDAELVDALLKALGAPADFPIGGRSLRDVLRDRVSLALAPDMLFQLVSYLTGGERRQKAKALAAGQDPDGDAKTLDVLAVLEKFSGIRPDPEAFIEALDPLQPRLYSISSSPKVDPTRIALTVDTVRYRVAARTRLGVASTFLADRLTPGEKLRVYIQKAQHFALPADPAVPIIMIGPGTGIAPFRAFLQERMATKAPGRNWLFFGHQRRDFDFFYEDELRKMRTAGLLTRLTLAWSRDAAEKIYVQDRMRDVGRDLWAWLAEGAYIYVCGDAQRMAKDVERAWVDVVAAHGARTTDEAIAFVAKLKKTGRYQTDVY
jgi:sulfite reductase (NADPH) flavoprotein alpha-component